MMLKRRLKLPSYLALFAAVLLAAASTGAGDHGTTALTDKASDVCQTRGTDAAKEPTAHAAMG